MNDEIKPTTENTSVEEQQIQAEFENLLEDYKNSNHRRKVEIVTKAYEFAKQAHAGIRRRDGTPYITHPLAVAKIVCSDMGLGSTSICSALLHDVVEDTEYTVEDISNMFGPKIAQIVDGLTKISGGIFGDQASSQAENFRRLLITMNDDIRVILIKIADRLHNMRTLGSMLPAKQMKIAGETIYLYAPMAHRLGLFSIKTELEDLSFKYEHPQEYSYIAERLSATETERMNLFDHFAKPVNETLQKIGLKYEMRARIKSVYSIWNKMQSKNVPFEDIYDIYAVRIIFDSDSESSEKKQCFEIYSVITDLYRTRPDRIRDWVSHPKANGYQALHITVMGPDGEWVEVQIRSRRMDEIAEKGFAAHWKYKGQKIEEDTELDKWLQTITEILENPDPNALDFLDTIKLNLFSSEIFVFTPKGDIKTLPQGATALDFAYALHTDIGNKCIGAKINHKLVPLSHKLASGDQVEILTSRSQEPKPEWINFVTTARAHSKVDSFLKRIRRDLAKEGETKIFTALEKAGLESSISNIEKLSFYHGFNKREDFIYSIGKGEFTLPDNLKKILTKNSKKSFFSSWMPNLIGGKSSEPVKEESKKETAKFDKKKPYILKEEAFNRNYVIAECCKPIPGDESIGFINDDDSVIVHKRSCPIAMRLKSSFGGRILQTEWDSHNTYSFDATLEVKGIDSIGVLNAISKIITEDYNVNIQRLLIEAKDGIFEGKINMKVHDVGDIHKICSTLSKLKSIKSIGRVAD